MIKLISTDLLIGKYVKIKINSKKTSNDEYIAGLVIDETRNTIKVQNDDNKIKIYPKSSISIEQLYGNKHVLVSGSLLQGMRPEERLKAEPKKNW